MAGGLLEGLVRLYTERDWWCKHLFFVAFAIITSLSELVKFQKNNTSLESSLDTLGVMLVLLLLAIIVVVVSGLFTLHFSHNCIKYFRKMATVENKKALKKIPLMPDFNGRLFNHFGDWACFTLAWGLFILVLGIMALIVSMLPILGLIAIPCVVIFISIAFPFVYARFAENYKTKGNLSPYLLFSAFPEVWKDTLWLWVRYIALYFVIALVLLIPYWVITTISSDSKFGLSIIYAYIGLVMSYVYCYSIAYIYCQNDV